MSEMSRLMTIKWLKWIQNMFPQDSEQYKALEQALSDVEKIDQIEHMHLRECEDKCKEQK